MNEFTKTCLFGALTIIILASALAARVIPARSDLWFDEVWTLWLLKPITNPWQIFWKINHDNNHFLNSLWMYALGPYRSSLLYRAPSVAFGVLAVAIAGWWGRKNGRVAAIIAMLLFATSYLMIDLTTQARGYSGLIVCTLLATIWTEDALE